VIGVNLRSVVENHEVVVGHEVTVGDSIFSFNSQYSTPTDLPY